MLDLWVRLPNGEEAALCLSYDADVGALREEAASLAGLHSCSVALHTPGGELEEDGDPLGATCIEDGVPVDVTYRCPAPDKARKVWEGLGTTLQAACLGGDALTVEVGLSAGEAVPCSVLSGAMPHECRQLLVDAVAAGPGIEATDWRRLLCEVIYTEDIAALRLFLQLRPRFRRFFYASEQFPLHVAVELGSAEAVALLARHPLLCMEEYDRSRTPLHGAALRGSFEILETLLCSGLLPHHFGVRNDASGTPFHIAAKHGARFLRAMRHSHAAAWHLLHRSPPQQQQHSEEELLSLYRVLLTHNNGQGTLSDLLYSRGDMAMLQEVMQWERDCEGVVRRVPSAKALLWEHVGILVGISRRFGPGEVVRLNPHAQGQDYYYDDSWYDDSHEDDRWMYSWSDAYNPLPDWVMLDPPHYAKAALSPRERKSRHVRWRVPRPEARERRRAQRQCSRRRGVMRDFKRLSQENAAPVCWMQCL